MSGLSGRTIIVVGASRGLGRAISLAFAEAGAPVVALARSGPTLAELASTNANIRTEVADATDATVAGSLLDRFEPAAVILVAGATPFMRPLPQQTWETFSVNWHTDVRIAFHWLRAALLKPLRPGSRVITISGGAAVAGSPLSGGYAGAKATQRFITAYAQDEAERSGLGITFTTVLPRITPLTDLGRPSRRTPLAMASPKMNIFNRWANRLPRRSPARPWSNSYGKMPPPLPRATCSAAPGCKGCRDGGPVCSTGPCSH